MSTLHLYNTLSRQLEPFEPLNPPFVGMYVCGPTLYSEAHLGNHRTYVSFDMIRRYLIHLGCQVRMVRNITDVGHLEDDSDDGEDKVEKRAKLEKKEPMEVVEHYKYSLHKICDAFNVLPPSIEPLASGHIPEQIDMVEKIIANGFAYEVNGNVYFDVRKFNESHPYGALSGRKIDDLLNETRDLDGQAEKRDPLDFAIWKNVPKEHIMKWKSPWTESGCPGWHIECSAMGKKYLGDSFDIHGGGMDLKFPHHEAEIAQNIGAGGPSPVKYWLHTNMLTFDGVKMSKSKGNSILPHELFSGEHPLLQKGFSPMVIRFLMMQSHYSSELDFSNEGLIAAETGFKRLCEAFGRIDKLKFNEGLKGIDDSILKIGISAKANMDNDFNTPKTVADLYELASVINNINDGRIEIGIDSLNEIKRIYQAYFIDILGLKIETAANNDVVDGLMNFIIDIRKNAREQKDWTTSDKIRDTMAALKIVLKDGKEGTEWSVG